MSRLRSTFLLSALSTLSACGPSSPGAQLAPTATSVPTTASTSQLPPTFEGAYRRLLEQMVDVDTSHGNETRLLDPIAALYRDAGVPVQILESGPGRGNLIARLKGSGAKKPLLLLAHVDVVPVEGQPWTVPPFATTEKEGFLWGRGVNDDKAMAAAIVAITLEFAKDHTPLTRDVIVALTAGEETGGSAGARWLAEKHKGLIDAEIALNEGGGMLLTEDFAKPVSVSLGVSEKVFQTFQLVVKGKGGHSSLPPTSGDPVVKLARALVKVGEHRFAATVLPEVKAQFVTEIGTTDTVFVEPLRHTIDSAPRIDPADDAILTKDARYNALIRTTCVTTMLNGSPQDNVLPTTAEATINCRILPGETRGDVKAALTAAIGDPDVTISSAEDIGDAASSPFDGEVPAAVKRVIGAMFPGTPVVPSMSTGATDSRHMRAIGIHAYGVSPGTSTRQEMKSGHSAHGPDERRKLEWIATGGNAFREIVRVLAM